jgi:hypothetical protein
MFGGGKNSAADLANIANLRENDRILAITRIYERKYKLAHNLKKHVPLILYMDLYKHQVLDIVSY